jgi:hypothetical protein
MRCLQVLFGGLEPPTPQSSLCIGRCSRLGSRAKAVWKMQAGYVETSIYIMVGELTYRQSPVEISANKV